jgi:hypothetical protein
VCLVTTTGCYTLQPVVGPAPEAGAQLGFDITDAGRVALGGSMGPSIARIEGRLLRRESADVVVAVRSVRFITGGEQTWAGEPVTLKPEYVGTTYVRRLSKSRTIAASALALGAVALIVTRSVNGGGTEETRTPPRDSLGTSSRGRRP